MKLNKLSSAIRFHWSKKSSNAKTGPIPTTMHSRATCPPDCPLMGNGCFGDNFPLALHWNRLSAGITGTGSWKALCDFVATIPRGIHKADWRSCVVGDLLADSRGRILKRPLLQLAKANNFRKAIQYSHHKLTKHNVATIQAAITAGFTINHSAENPADAVKCKREHGIPAVCILPADAPKSQMVDGMKIFTCPATYREDITCANCGLCAEYFRPFIIGFPAHGTRKSKVEVIASRHMHARKRVVDRIPLQQIA